MNAIRGCFFCFGSSGLGITKIGQNGIDADTISQNIFIIANAF